MLSKLEGCSGCVLEHKGKGFCPDQDVADPSYIVYGEAPGGVECEAGKPFQGKAGFVLKHWIMKAVPHIQLAEDKHKISYRNVLKCLPPETQGRPYPRGEERYKAEAQCKQYQAPINAKTVILCGEVPQRFFFQQELDAEDISDRRMGHDTKGVMGRVGRVYIRDNARFVFAPHPAFVLRQPALVRHGQRSFQIATNLEQVLSVDTPKWSQAMEVLL